MAANPIFQRLQLLTGTPAMEHLQKMRVIIFGIGGVGSWCAEALVRSGIFHLTIVDSDVVCITNVNRQLQATVKNVGKSKVEELKNRLLDINPRAQINAVQKIYDAESSDEFHLENYDYIIDCIDSLSNKVHLILASALTPAKLFSSMGAACKLDATKIRVDSIWESVKCPLARLIRRRLRKAGFHGDFSCVYSAEVLPNSESVSVACGTHSCMCPKFISEDGQEEETHEWCSSKKVINGSAVHITATFGMMLSGMVIQDIYGKYNEVIVYN